MNDIQNGFIDLAQELERIADKITDDRTKIKALEAGAKPIVARAKTLASRLRDTGQLIQSIGAQYSERSNTMRVGIGEPISTTDASTGFYGRFQDRGWHVTRRGKSSRSNKGAKGRWTKKARLGRRTGRFVRNPFIEPAYEAERERVGNIMFEVYKKEID